MRNLTLGVLLVAGGTLASLPFRRYQPIPDASVIPEEATGPTQSALGTSHLDMIAGTQFTAPPNPSELEAMPHWPIPPNTPATTQVPSSYEELAVPLDRLSPDPKAFSALQNSDSQTDSRRAAIADNRGQHPSFESTVVNTTGISNLAARQNGVDSSSSRRASDPPVAASVLVDASNTPSADADTQRAASTQLASTSRVESNQKDFKRSTATEIERLPTRSKRKRIRQWIRQPD
ncbi:MAG: hypothetical protein HKN47_14805 [Pirellulaceae bacterium]|nr:hypothetical protein [Pirellulaceae bacterium]